MANFPVVKKLVTGPHLGSAHCVQAKCGKPKPCFGPCWNGDTPSAWMYLGLRRKGCEDKKFVGQLSWVQILEGFFSLTHPWKNI